MIGTCSPAKTGQYQASMMNMIPSEPLPATGPSRLATQVAALCWRRQDAIVQVLLITSRETGRWVIPKGWPITGLTLAEAAAQEAWEEAGVQGRVQPQPLGAYLYDKITGPARSKRCNVDVFALQVEALKDHFPEAAQRRRTWFAASEAAGLVAEPDLSALLSRIAAEPDRLSGAAPGGTA
jgi:8-oxo-dGTP pyrophosphatase MutT (NUDIX family)